MSAQGACNARLSSRRNRKRGDQGVDGMNYTERTGTASNGLRRSWLFLEFDAANHHLVTSHLVTSQFVVALERNHHYR